MRSLACAYSYHFQVWRVKYCLALIQDFLERRLQTQVCILEIKHAASLEVLYFIKGIHSKLLSEVIFSLIHFCIFSVIYTFYFYTAFEELRIYQ